MSETARPAASDLAPGLGDLLSPAELAVLEEFCEKAEELLGSDLLDSRLYGSRARGEVGEDSDLDLALIVTPAGAGRRRDLQGLGACTA